MEVSTVENEVLLEEADSDRKNFHDELDLEEGKFSNQIHSLSNLQSFNDVVFTDGTIIKSRDVVHIPEASVTLCRFSLIFTSHITYKNFHILRNQFLLIFKVTYPEDFFQKIYEKKYFTIFGIDKSTKELICFSVININDKSAEILALGVVKEYQNKKIGSILLKKVVEELQIMGINHVELIVQQINEVALKLYVNSGFTIYKQLNGYYNFKDEKDNHAYIMTKKLVLKTFWVYGVFRKISQRLCCINNRKVNKF